MVRHVWKEGQVFHTCGGGELEVLNFLSHTHCEAVCKYCHSDSELFPAPLVVNKYKLKNGQKVCSCGNSAFKWDRDQYIVKVNREAENRKYTTGPFPKIIKNSTKILLYCTEGHEYTTTVDNLLNDKRKKGCGVCAKEKLSSYFRRPLAQVEEDLKDFMRWNKDFEILGCWKEDYKNSASIITFKHSVCGKNTTRPVRDLRRAKRISCCSRRAGSPKDGDGYFYINLFLFDSGDYCIKYGITINNPRFRKGEQKRKAPTGTRAFTILSLPLKNSTAFLLEESLYDIFNSRNISRELLPDGYSESITNVTWKDVKKINELIRNYTAKGGLLFWKNG